MVILETIRGSLTIDEACRQLDIGQSMFHKLRSQVLESALSSLEPRPVGRPPRAVTEESLQITALENDLRDLQLELRASEVRRELAETLPHVLRTDEDMQKKTTGRRRQQRKQRGRRRRNNKPK